MKKLIILSMLAMVTLVAFGSSVSWADNAGITGGQVQFARWGGGGLGLYVGPSFGGYYGGGFYGPYGTYGDYGGYGYYNEPDRYGNTGKSCVWNGYNYKCYKFN